MSLGGPKTTAPTIASGVDIQSSCYGGVIPVWYGRTRGTANLIDYDDFQAIQRSSSGSGKGGGSGGGGKGGSTTTDYKTSFIFALGEGTTADIQNVYASKTVTAFADSGLTFFDGSLTQSPWGTWVTKHPTKALSYAGTAYVCAAAYDLGQSAQLPNLAFEVTGLFPNAISGLPDADPKDVVTDILTNPRYGVGFPSARLGSLSVFSSYCRATGMVISPLFNSQSDAASQLNQIVQDCNSEFVWSGKSLTIVPYGDQNITANGATYTAPSAPLYSLGDNDFIDTGDGDPVKCSRTRPSDAWNRIYLEYLNRANQYNAEIVTAENSAAVEAYGLRVDQPSQSHQFCDLGAATMAATLKLQRQAVRNVYSFTLGWRYCLLDPMDIVEITDEGIGLVNQWVRILTLEEDDNGNIAVSAEEYLDGTGAAPLYSYSGGAPFIADYNTPPGNVNTPLIFEPPPAMLAANSITAPQIMVGASGGPNWGGCDVWLSLDGSTYKLMGRISAPSRQGALLNTLASAADPDTTHTLSVDLSESHGALLSGIQADADAFRTLCYVDGELIAYETAALTGSNQYGLSYLRRGVFGTTIAAHAAGTLFCRLDDSVASFDLPVTPVSYVGETLHLKFLSFNIYGGGEQQLGDVSAYTYNPNGAGEFVYPPTGVTFTVGAEQQKDGTWISFGVVSWTASPDPLFDQYEVQYRTHVGPGAWVSWRGGKDTTSFVISPLPPNTAFDVQVRAVRTTGPFYSAWDQNLNTTSVGKTTAPPAPTSPSCSGGYRQITLDWVASAENDIAWYEIWESADNDLAHASRIGLVNSTHYVRPGLNLNDTRYYWIRAQDTSGNFSTYLGPVSATTLGVEAADITTQLVLGQIAANAITASNLISGLDVVQVVASIGTANPATSNVAYESSTATLYRWNGTAWISSISSADIPAGAIDITKFASGLTPVQVVSSLPAGTEGETAVLTTTGKLYRYHSGAWTVATDGADITANSITAGSIAAGAIGVNQLAAQAVTASKVYIGDTTNLVLDPSFQDANYWQFIFSPAGNAQSYYQTSASGNYVNTPKYVVIFVGGLTASGYSGVQSAGTIAVSGGAQYNLTVNAFDVGAPSTNLDIRVDFYDSSHAFISSSATTSCAPNGSASIQNPTVNMTSPANAAYASVLAFVSVSGGGGSGYWCVSNFQFVRRLQGALIVDGTITATQIAAGTITATQIAAGTIDASKITAGTLTAAQIYSSAGITGNQIAASTITALNIAGLTITGGNIAGGTITGDKITGNFFQGYNFTASSGGAAYVQMFGGQNTSGGLTYGPYFAAVDGAGHARCILGHYAGADGLWVFDSSGNVIFEESALGTNVVSTSNVIANNITYPYGASITPSTFVLFNHTADATGEFTYSATVAVEHAGGAMGNPPGHLRTYINGTKVAEAPAPVMTFAVPVLLGGAVSVNAGDSILIRWEETVASTTDTTGGTMSGIICQR
jgi:hypothetical protein